MYIPTDQGFSMKYHYSRDRLKELKELVIKGGNAVIGNDYLQCSNGYLRHFKHGKFEGPNYSMPLDGMLEIIDEAIRSMDESV